MFDDVFVRKIQWGGVELRFYPLSKRPEVGLLLTGASKPESWALFCPDTCMWWPLAGFFMKYPMDIGKSDKEFLTFMAGKIKADGAGAVPIAKRPEWAYDG